MTFDEGVYSAIGVTVALIAVANILWIIMQAIALYEGYRPRPMRYWRNMKEIRQLFRNQDNPTRRRICMLIMHLYDACPWVAVVCFAVLFLLFFIGVLR